MTKLRVAINEAKHLLEGNDLDIKSYVLSLLTQPYYVGKVGGKVKGLGNEKLKAAIAKYYRGYSNQGKFVDLIASFGLEHDMGYLLPGGGKEWVIYKKDEK